MDSQSHFPAFCRKPAVSNGVELDVAVWSDLLENNPRECPQRPPRVTSWRIDSMLLFGGELGGGLTVEQVLLRRTHGRTYHSGNVLMVWLSFILSVWGDSLPFSKSLLARFGPNLPDSPAEKPGYTISRFKDRVHKCLRLQRYKHPHTNLCVYCFYRCV